MAFGLYCHFFLPRIWDLFSFFCKSQCQGHYPLSSTLPVPSSPWPPPPFPWKFSVHCPPDSHPSTRVQFKKPFNSCHSKGPAISPAAKAQTGTRHQRATLNVRSVFPHPPIPNGLKVKDSISQRLLQRKTDGLPDMAQQTSGMHSVFVWRQIGWRHLGWCVRFWNISIK